MYIVSGSNSFVVIDPSVLPSRVIDNDKISSMLKELSFKGIFITHGHFDHILALPMWNDMYPDVPIYMHPLDMKALVDPEINCSADMFYDMKFHIPVVDVTTADLDLTDDFSIGFIHTPGHSPGEVVYTLEGDGERLMFTGDMLFRGSVGRTDLPGGDAKQMMASLDIFKSIEADYTVYPGHGLPSTLKEEKRTNPFLT